VNEFNTLSRRQRPHLSFFLTPATFTEKFMPVNWVAAGSKRIDAISFLGKPLDNPVSQNKDLSFAYAS
jgi:hypothetical protein